MKRIQQALSIQIQGLWLPRGYIKVDTVTFTMDFLAISRHLLAFNFPSFRINFFKRYSYYTMPYLILESIDSITKFHFENLDFWNEVT